MAEYYDIKDKMRRAAQDEQAMRVRPVPVSPDVEGAPSTARVMPAPPAAAPAAPTAAVPPSSDVNAPIEIRRQVFDGPRERRREPAVVRTAKGAGGYEYAELADGSFKILRSPTTNVGKIVKAGDRGYNDIKAEMARIAKPAARAAAPRDELFPEAGFKGAIETRSPLEETLGATFEEEMREVPNVPFGDRKAAPRTGSVVGDRILNETAREVRSAPPAPPPMQGAAVREMQERIARSENPTYRQMVGETERSGVRASMGKDLTDAFAFMGQNPEMARTNAEALLSAYQKSGDPTVLRAIQSIIAAKATR